MKYPNFNEEKKLWKKGYKIVVGMDEAGRGPLAGPVVAAAFAVSKFSIFLDAKQTPRKVDFQLSKVNDSKKLSPKKREEIYEILINNPNIEWGIGRVSEKIIDKINILEATKLAILKAVKNLKTNCLVNFSDRRNLRGSLNDRLRRVADKKINSKSELIIFDKRFFLIIDGNFGINTDIPQKSIIKGDQKVFSIAAASIIAKVYRDRLMKRYHKKYPQYGFDVHKGYPTKSHCQALKQYGP